MIKLLRDFIREEDGLSTVEIVVIIAVLVGIALIFRKAIFAFVQNIINKVFQQGGAATDTNEADTYTPPATE